MNPSQNGFRKALFDLCPHFSIETPIKTQTESRSLRMKKRILAMVSFAAVVTFALACTTTPTNLSTNSSAPVNSSVSAELKPAFDSITANDILQHIKVLSSDEYEGRGPGTKGEELT